MHGYNLPLDPECPEVLEYHTSLWNDPMTVESGCGDEFQELWDREHRAVCKRCQDYGCENIEVVGS